MSKKPLKAIVEAILFASDEPVAVKRLADAAGEGVTAPSNAWPTPPARA